MKAIISAAIVLVLYAEALPVESDLYGAFYVCSYTLLAIALAVSTGYEDVAYKTLLTTFALSCCVNSALQVFCGYYEWCLTDAYAVAVVGGALALAFTLFKPYTLPVAPYERGGSYIVFKKPKNPLALVLSMPCRPVSSVSVVSRGFQYAYRVREPYERIRYVPKENHVYIPISVSPKEIDAALRPLIGRAWSRRANCCHAVLRLYPTVRRSMLISIPCFLINTILKESKCQIQPSQSKQPQTQ